MSRRVKDRVSGEEIIPATSFFITVTRVRQKKKGNEEKGEEEERKKKGAKIKRTRKSAKAKHGFLVSGGREIWASTSPLSNSTLCALSEKQKLATGTQ